MNKVYLGIDIGSESVKGIIMDDDKNIIASEYLYIEKNVIDTTKRLISILKQRINNSSYKIISFGTTGVARKLIGTILGADVIKNEIVSHAIGIIMLKPDVKTIIDIGGQDIKIITLKDGGGLDYNISNLYTLDCEGDLLLDETQEKNIINYLIGIYKNEGLRGPISIQGGWSKNKEIVRCIKKLFKENIYVDEMSEFLGAFGVAILAKNKKNKEKIIVNNISFEIEKFNNYFKEYEKISLLRD